MKHLFILLIVTFTLFLTFQTYFPFVPFFTDNTYAYVEDISIKFLSALIISLLFFKSSNKLTTIVLGGASGGLFFLAILGVKVVDPTQIGWIMRGDWQWHFMGWHFFRGEAWHFPLGKITNFFYPVGTSIGYTDSIPLLAFVFKPFHSLLPSDFQYLGLWILLCFILQGVFGILLLRLLTTNRFLQWIGALFFVLSPVLLHRIGHIALSAHWLLLAGLWLYFKSWQTISIYRPLASWSLLVGISALIHPYLTVMVLGLATAFYGRWWLIERRGTIYTTLGQLSCLGLLTLILWWQVGYILIDSQQRVANELGRYSMNLLTFVNPFGWSLLIRDFPLATDGQYEGFGYLGAGMLLLTIFVIYELSLRPIGSLTVKRVLPLVIIISGTLFFAISSKVTISSWVLFAGDSQWLTVLTPFQSSGRFVWLAYYAIMFAVFNVLITRHPVSKALLFISFGLAVQMLDLQGIHQQHREQRLDADWQIWDNPLQDKVWTFAAPYYQHITFVPPIACGEPPADYLPFAYLAASYGLTLNTGQAARFDAEKTAVHCQALFTQIQQGQVEENTIYLIHPARLKNFTQLAKKPLTCAEVDGISTCITTTSYLRWHDAYGN